jgi:hypothetical protein
MALTDKDIEEAVAATADQTVLKGIPMGPPGSTVREPDDEYAARSREIAEYYQSLEANNIDRSDLLPPVRQDRNPFVDVANIFLHDEMAAVGVSLDQNNFDWNLKNAKEAWTEHPIRSGIATALGIVPGLMVATKPLWAFKMGGIGDDVLKSVGLVDDIGELAKMSSRDKTILRTTAYNIQKQRKLETKIEAGTASFVERQMYGFNKRFGNTYLQLADPDAPVGVRAAYLNRMTEVIKGKEINRYLKNLPDEKHGPAIAKYLQDAGKLTELPNNVRPWAMRLRDDLRTLQSQARREGMLSEEEAAKIGDVWFSTLRKGTPLQEEGRFTTVFSRGRGGKTEMINVPRTSSAHFLERKTSKEELSVLINRQQAAEALERGQSKKALSLLKEDDPIAGMIRAGDESTALGALKEGGQINLTPESLTMRSLLQQRLLFENFRYLRDIALNPDITKSADEIAALGRGARKKWVNLDDPGVLPNASRVRRMVARKTGNTGEAPLGFVHKSIFREMSDIDSGFRATSNGMVDLLSLLTAVHKTAKTAFNLPTHFQNMLGNYVFLINAGFNPMSGNGFDLMYKKALPAVWKAQRAHRKGSPITDLGNVGVVESKIGGDAINIGSELGSFEVGELIERSSLMASEGVGILERMAKRTNDHAGLTNGLLKFFQKTLGLPGLNHASDAYMAEDAFAKFAYFLDLRSRGFNRVAASLEVSRRMPMYHTLGPAQTEARKWLLPWISFPAESVRVLKNNLMDYPLRTAAMLHSVNAIQALMYPSTGQSYEGLQAQKEQLPMWAQTPVSTIMTPLRDDNDDIRSAVLDFMPHAAFLPNTIAKDAPLLQKLPLGMDQPFPIMTGLMNAMTGKGSFGQPIPTDPDKPSQLIWNAVANTASFVAPPLVQKYLLNTNTPTHTYRLQQDFGSLVNPATLKPGVRMFDMFVNNASAIKMYPASPEQQIANNMMTTQAVRNYRGKLTTNWNAWVRSGDWVTAGETLKDIQQTYIQEFGDPAVAESKFRDWLKRHARDIAKHPMMRSMSREDIIAKLHSMGPDLAIARSDAQARYIETLREEIIRRGPEGGGSSSLSGLGGGGLSGVGGGI